MGSIKFEWTAQLILSFWLLFLFTACQLFAQEKFEYTKHMVMLETDIIENGNSIRLETWVYEPKDKRRPPVLIINHGSTNGGTKIEEIKASYDASNIAGIFAGAGWVVIVPNRRGRGKSDGLYDEGFRRDRKKGYSIYLSRVKPGVERALRDIDEVFAKIQVLAPAADTSKVVISGISRGGALSVAYAGKNPEKVIGVVNFVGSWNKDNYANPHFNQISSMGQEFIFRYAEDFKRPALWLYGFNDNLVDVRKRKKYFDKYVCKNGVGGAFHAYTVTEISDGHALARFSRHWEKEVLEYMSNMVGGEQFSGNCTSNNDPHVAIAKELGMIEKFGETWVKILQKKLKLRGYYFARIDGKFGPQTKKAMALCFEEELC